MLSNKTAMNVVNQEKFNSKLLIQLVSLIFFCLASSLVLASDYISDAKKLIDENEYQAAIIYLKNQLKQKPNDAEARYLLGISYQESGNITGALKELEKAYSLDNKNNKIQLAYASILQFNKENEKIKTILSKTYDDESEESERLVILGRVALSENKIAGAKELINKAKKTKDSSEVQIELSRLALAEKNNAKAEKIIDMLLSKDSNNKNAMFLKAVLLSKRSEYEESISIFDKLLKKEPSNLRYLLERAGIKYQKKDFEGAEHDLSIVLKQNESIAAANYMMSLIKIDQDDYSAARQYAQRVLNVMPNDNGSKFLSGISEFKLGNLNQAEKYLTQVLFDSPNNLNAQNVLANIYIAKNEGEQALLLLESIDQEIVDQNSNLLLSFGTAYLLTGQYQKGIAELNKAKKLAPENQLIENRLVSGYLKSKNIQEAIAELEASATDKDNKQAQYMLVMIYLQEKELEKAKASIEKYKKQTPDDPNLYNFQAVLHLLNDNQDLALASYKKAIEIDGNFIPAYLGVVKIYMENKQFIQADDVFKKILLINDKYIKAWIGRAAIAENSGDDEKVEYFLKEGLIKVKGDIKSEMIAVQQLSRWYIKQGQKTKVLELGRDLIYRYPDESSAIFFNVKSLMLNGKYSQTSVLLEKLVYSEPGNKQYKLLLVAVLVEKKDYQRALTLLDEILVSSPDDKQTLLLKGKLFLGSLQYKEAHQVSKDFQQLFPEDERGFQLEGDILLAKKEYNSAIEEYKTAFQKGSNNQILVKVVDLYIKLSKINEAIEFLTNVINENDANKVARYRLALLLQNQGKDQLAAEQYQILLKNEPENVLIINNLAWILFEQGDERALKFGQKAYQLKPNSPAVLDTYGYILIEAGRLEEGVKLLEKAVIFAPKTYDIHYHLAKGYYLSGNNLKAKDKLSDILNTMTDFSEKENAKTLFNQLQSLN